jgi:hypothetical protein
LISGKRTREQAEALEFEQRQVDRALLVQMLGLNFDQMALCVEMGTSFLGQLGISLGRLRRYRCRGRVQAGLGDRAFNARLWFRTQYS